MSVDIVILSPMPPSEFGMVEAEAAVLLDEWRDRHRGAEDGAGRISLGGVIPDAAAAQAMVRPRAGGRGPDDSADAAAVLRRLATIRSAITLEGVGDLKTHPVLVSVLRLVAQQAGPALIQLVDGLELSETTLARLANLPEAPGFADGAPPDDDADLPPMDLAALTAVLGRAAAGRRRPPVDRDPPADPPRQSNAVDVPRLIVDRLAADGHIALDPKGRRDSLEKKLEAAMSADDERSPVRALIEVLLEHDAVAEVFGSDAELEASMRAALQTPPRS